MAVPRVQRPIRVKATAFLHKEEDFRKYVRLAAAQAAGQGVVLILLDCEDHCPATLGPDLLARARTVRDDQPCRLDRRGCRQC